MCVRYRLCNTLVFFLYLAGIFRVGIGTCVYLYYRSADSSRSIDLSGVGIDKQ